MKKIVEKIITDSISLHPLFNRFWDLPVIGVAMAGDRLFDEIKKWTWETHLLPNDILPGAKSVIAYYIPFLKDVINGNVRGRWASPLWANAYIETNKLIVELGLYIKNEIKTRYGANSESMPPTGNFDAKTLLCNWSHRHVAYIAGLGTLGLNNMLITSKGSAGRIGSLVTELDIEPTKRPDFEYCLFKRDGSCMKCIDRCKYKALTKIIYDRHRCYKMCLANERRLAKKDDAQVCGKCGVGVPCAMEIP